MCCTAQITKKLNSEQNKNFQQQSLKVYQKGCKNLKEEILQN